MLDANGKTQFSDEENAGLHVGAADQISSIIHGLAKEVGRYTTLFLFASIVGAYVYNSVFFYNVDGELFFNVFLPLLSYNDYISTMFSFIPPAAVIFVCAILGRFILDWASKLLSTCWESVVSACGVYVQGNFRRNSLFFKVARNVYLIAIFVLFCISVTVKEVQPRYNWSLLLVSLLFLIAYIKLRSWACALDAKNRVLYAVVFLMSVVCVLSSIVGSYRFELALQDGKKTVTMEYQGVSMDVSAARVLEKGVFFIVPSADGGYMAHFNLYEGGQQFCRKVVSEKLDWPFWKRVFYNWFPVGDKLPRPKGGNCRLGA